MAPTLLRNFTINSGDGLDMLPGFFVKGIRVDNYTSVWYKIQPQGYIIPPATTGWTTDLPQSAQAINIQPTTYSNQPNYIFTGDTLTVTVFSDPVGISGGSPSIPNDQRSAIFTAAPGATLSTGTLSFPATGTRIDNLTGTWYQIGSTGILVPPWTTGFTIDISPAIVALTLTPATPPYGPPNSATGTGITLTLYASKIGNYGGTTYTPPVSTSQLIQAASGTSGTNSVTATLSAVATVGHLLVAALGYQTDNSGLTITPPAGWTSIITSGVGAGGYWLGYRLAIGGETGITFSVSAGQSNYAMTLSVAEYDYFTTGTIQTGSAAGANSASATPITSPSLLIALSAYGSNGSNPLPVTSNNSTLRVSPTIQTGTNYGGSAIGDQPYTLATAKTGTITWTGHTALATAVITAE